MRDKGLRFADVLILSSFFVLAFILRFAKIGLLPINHDEAIWARFLLNNPQFMAKFIGIPISSFLFLLPSYLTIHAGKPEFPLMVQFMADMRFQSAAIGAFTVMLTYLLSLRMYGRLAAVISSSLLCFLPWHVIQSGIAGRVIWVPFLGCAIFLSLFKAVNEKKKLKSLVWLALSGFLLNKSTYIYETSLIFIPVCAVSLLLIYAGRRCRSNVVSLAASLLIVFWSVSDVILAITRTGESFWDLFFCRVYHTSIFKGCLLLNIWKNAQGNAGILLKQLFFDNSTSSFLYGEALKYPLFIHPAILLVLSMALILAIYKRTTGDKILLAWLGLGLFCITGGVGQVQIRYALIILIPLVILIGRCAGDAFSYALKRARDRAIGVSLFLAWLIFMEAIQLSVYYAKAPYELDQCRNNSYGSREAAEYLAGIPDISSYSVFTDLRMTVDVYLNYFMLKNKKIDKYFDFSAVGSKKIIYVLWAPESHSSGYWGGAFSHLYDSLTQAYPGIEPVKIIYYPNGLAAIKIFKLLESEFGGMLSAV